MISRPSQQFLTMKLCLILSVMLSLVFTGPMPVPTASAAVNLTQYANPLMGSEDRMVEPDAVVPFGMVAVGPNNLDHTRYDYSRTTITGFDFEPDVYSAFTGFMPITSAVTTSPYSDRSLYSSTYDHADESASPGYYQVRLSASNINVELTATKRTAMTKLTYPSGSSGRLLIFTNTKNSSSATDSSITIDAANRKVYGYADGISNTSMREYFVYYFDKPFTAHGTWNGSTVTAGSSSAIGNVGAYLDFGSSPGTVQARVGISYVSVANADLNLSTENPNWSFSAIRTAADTAWNNLLNRIVVTANGTANELTKFYSFLYMALKHPHIYSDVNGQYFGFDNQVKTASGYTQYHYMPGWDQYRSHFPLIAMLAPSVANDVVKSIIAMGEQTGGELFNYQRYNFGGDKNWHGDPAPIFVSTAYSFGARNYNAKQVLDTLIKQSNLDGAHTRKNTADYINNGYMGYEKTNALKPTSTNMEYYQSDFAIAWLAKQIGHEGTYREYLQRANAWSSIFHPTLKTISPRHTDGSWMAGFQTNHITGLYEGSAMQYSWNVGWNLNMFMHKVGGLSDMQSRLDSYSASVVSNFDTNSLNISNQVSYTHPYLGHWVGQPYKSQATVRRILNNQFTVTNMRSVTGEEDYGAGSSWFVWGALGMYPAIQGTDAMMLVTPLFPSAIITLESGKVININAPGATHNTTYIQSAKLNGTTYNKSWIWFSELSNGATLEFTPSTTSNPSWASSMTDVPPSYSSYNPYKRMEAENFDMQSGLTIVPTTDSSGGNAELGNSNHNDYVVYKNVHFGNGATQVTARLSSGVSTAGAVIELRKDSTGGTLLGTISASYTGSWDTYVNRTATLGGATGTFDLYMVYKNPNNTSNAVADVNWLEFTPGSSATDTHEAEYYQSENDVLAFDTSDSTGGEQIGYLVNNDYAVYKGVNFGSGVSSVSLRFASGSSVSGGTVEFRLGSPTGTLIASVNGSSTGGWQTWATRTATVSSVTGTHDVYMVFKKSSGDLGSVNWFKFNP